MTKPPTRLALMRKALLSPRSLVLTFLALLLIAGCVIASLWQYHRGVARHAANAIVKANIVKPALTEQELKQIITNSTALSDQQWRLVTLTGTFDQRHEILLRNRYVDGAYGFGVLTLFHLNPDQFGIGKSVWVDRGWVAAGKDATTPPTVVSTTSEKVQLKGRLRTFDRTPQIQGSFFALPSSANNATSSTADLKTQLKKWNASEFVDTENFSLDLLSASDESLTPAHPNELPELSDGPHMAYALQWLAFAILVALGRILIFREDLRLA